jgi:hypothetical protein
MVAKTLAYRGGRAESHLASLFSGGLEFFDARTRQHASRKVMAGNPSNSEQTALKLRKQAS